MNELIEKAVDWLSDALLGKVAASLLALALGITLLKVALRAATRYIVSWKFLQEIEAMGGSVSIAASTIELFPKTPFEVRTKDGPR